SHDRFKHYVFSHGWRWPATPTGKLSLEKTVRKEKASLYPEFAPLHELISTLSLMRRESISVGSDGRSRTSLFAFRSKTSRNLPSSAKFIFGAPSWMRSFAKPKPGFALSYLDYAQEEFLIAGALSEDKAMIRAYETEDPYINFAKTAGAVPP